MSNNRTILSRPRTRIYDSNYNIGESYYKGALDSLDRKYYGRSSSPPRQPLNTAAEIAERHARIFAEEDLEDSRRRASSKIRENNMFDYRGPSRFSRNGNGDLYDDEGITDETSATLKRIRAQKKVAIVDDVDLESTSNAIKTYRMLDRSEKILDSVGINDSAASRRALDGDFSYSKRALKVSYDMDNDNLTKWSPVPALENGESTSGAALRARQSRARLDDLEEEMNSISEKQAARERRVARLKQLVAECDAESVDDSGAVVSVTEKRVRF